MRGILYSTTAISLSLPELSAGSYAPAFWVYPDDSLRAAVRPIGQITRDISTRPF
jgi:hypothetical protein